MVDIDHTKKPVRLSNEEDIIPEATVPIVSPPPMAATGQLNKNDNFTAIEMQQKQEDNFFYNTSHDSWSSNKSDEMTLKNASKQDLTLEDTSKLLVNEAVDDDDDDEFNWNDDPENKPKRRKTTREKIQAAMKSPCCWHYLSPVIKRILIALFGSCIFIVIAIVIHVTLPEPTEAQFQDPNFTNIRSNIQCWMYWAAFMWHIFWLTTFMLDIVPSIVSLWIKIFKGRRSEKVKSYMEYYMSVKDYLGLLIIAAWNIGSWVFLINVPFDSIKNNPYSQIVTKVFGCTLAATFLFFIQKTIIQHIAIKFHRTAFSERIEENKESLKILDMLSKSEMKSRPTSSNFSSSSNLRKRNKPIKHENLWDPHSSSTDEKECGTRGFGFSKFKKSISNFVLAEKPTNTTGRIKTDINSDDFAKKVAKKLFYALAYPQGFYETEDGKKCLTVFDFVPYFNDREQAFEAFKIFDKDGNGDITRREFRDTVIYIYRERKDLAQAIRDTSQALGKVDLLLLAVTILITTCICLSIFSVDFWTALIPFGTFLAACTFIFDTSAKSLFAGIMFQFVTHPYDAGDLVKIDDSYMSVDNIGILGTVFISGDGRKVYAPTSVLVTKLISNIRRSGDMGEVVIFNVDFRTDNDLIMKLRERLLEWVHSQPRDFHPGFDLRVTDIIDMNQVILTCWLPHKGNWMDLSKRFQRKTRFMLALKSILTELDIKYELPAQRITSTEKNPFTDPPSHSQTFSQH